MEIVTQKWIFNYQKKFTLHRTILQKMQFGYYSLHHILSEAVQIIEKSKHTIKWGKNSVKNDSKKRKIF